MTRPTEAAPDSALVRIKRKEIELQARLLSARRDAEEVVAAARVEADRLLLERRAAAEAEADAIRDAELEEARREADRVRRAFEERAEAERRGGSRPDLAERIVGAVAPTEIPPNRAREA